MAVTIKSVAKLAGVAPSTVSRVLADNPRISKNTKEQVRQAMNELGYHPNHSARSLVNKSTRNIGVVMPSSGNNAFQNPFFPEVIRGIGQKAHDNKYGLYLTTGNTSQEIYDEVVDLQQSGRVDGIIILYSRINDQVLDYLNNSSLPFVVLGRPYKSTQEITFVDNDNYSAAKEATEYLIQHNHRKIGFVGGSLELMVTVDRLSGYKEALKEAQIDYRDDYVVQEEFLKAGGSEAISRLISTEQPPTGLIVTDDLMSLGVLNTLHDMKIKVPQDMSIVSFNNVLLAELSTPALTSVDIDIFSLGYEALKALIEIINNSKSKPRKILVSHKLEKRCSCEFM